jgi:uncharacterized membrane protein YphA (DoxX/SURF4 family)
MVSLLLAFMGAIFVTSGLGKLLTDETANRFLEGLGVPAMIVRPVDRGVSLVEVALGILLFSGRIARWSVGLAIVLTGVFLAAHVVARWRGSSASCGCFGAMDTDLIPALSLLRSALLLSVAIGLAWGLYAGTGTAGVPVSHVQTVLSGVMTCATYLLGFRLLNETLVFTRRNMASHRRLQALAAQVEMAAQLNDP